MNDPIGTTPADVIQLILAICGAIITVSGAITVIVRMAMKAKAPNRKQNERLDSLEKEVSKINERLEKGDKHFADDSDRINAVEMEMRETNKVIIQSLQALTVHALDGNNIEELKNSNKILNDYLLNKV